MKNLLSKAILVLIISVILFVAVVVYGNITSDVAQTETSTAGIHDLKVDLNVAAPVEPVAQTNQLTEPQKTTYINENYTQTLTPSMGVCYYNGLRETYYSSAVAPHYRLDEWWTDQNGFWRTEEGYFVVAYTMTEPIGSIINISMGQAQICDHCPTNGAVDIYTTW